MLKKTLRFLALLLLPLVGYTLIRILYITVKKNFHIPQRVSDEPTIFACWHGDLFFFAPFYVQYTKRVHARVLISNHFDGAFIAKTIEYFGLEILAGSTTRNAVKVLIGAMKSLKDGYDIGITPDGPKGPRHEVADGIVVMAQKQKAKVVLMRIEPKEYWQFHSWDRFKIPKPFTTVDFYASDAIDLCGMEFEEAREYIKKGLLSDEN